MRKGGSAIDKWLRVNPIACSGHGVCAELLPEMITLDEWGYPLLDQRAVPPSLERQARRAVSGCPALALRLTRMPDGHPGAGVHRASHGAAAAAGTPNRDAA